MNEIPTVAQRMNGMGPAKGTGINKKFIKQNLFNKSNQQGQARSQQKANPIPYRVPGQPAQPLAAPQQGQAPVSPLVNQLKPRIGTLNPNSGTAGQAQNAILRPGYNDNPYYYKPVMPDFSSIDPNDPDEIRYQQNIKAQQEAGKNGAPVQAIAYSSKARNDIIDKTRETNRLGQERMTAARKADPRSRDMVNYAAVNR